MFRLFDHEKDLPIINAWARAYKLPETTREHLPTYGVISDHVAGFLYCTDSAVVILDNVIGKRYDHTEADLDQLVEALEALARSLGYKYIIAHSEKFPVMQLGKRHGYHVRAKFSQLSKVL